MIIVFCQKPSVIEYVVNMLDKNTNEDYICFSSIYNFQSSEGIASNIWMNIPKKISYADIPYIKNPILSLKRNNQFVIFSSLERKMKRVDELNVTLLDNNEYIYIGDNEGHYLLNFINFINVLGKPKKISMTYIHSMDEKSLLHSFNNRTDFNFNNPELNVSSINRNIDYLFFINGLVLFNEMRKKSLDPLINNISKEDIQILYKIRDKDFDFLNGFQGSEKYKRVYFPLTLDNYPFTHLSLITSNLEKLKSLGFIKYHISQVKHSKTQQNKDNFRCGYFIFEPEIHLTELGSEFLDSLHPDCKDYDIFGRILSWKDLPKTIVDKKIENYIKLYFGKQKKYNKNKL